MRLILTDHDYKYAAEQIMLTMFPGERPEYEGGAEFCALIKLSKGAVYTTASTVITALGKRCYGKAVSKIPADDILKARTEQRLIKLSFYKAAIQIVEKPPQWGALTGIRPAKLAAAMLDSGDTDKSAALKLMNEYYVSEKRAELCVSGAKAALKVKAAVAPRDICLYIGIPFCPTRCAYCSFVSGSVEKSFHLIEPFSDMLLHEIETISKTVKDLGLRVISVYIGGGTPTVLSAKQLDVLMTKLSDCFDLADVREYTVEAGRPDTISIDKLSVITQNGATRISVNPQSMRDHVLLAIGRSHKPCDISEAVRLVKRYPNISLNMDLIAGLPGDSVEGFCHSLDSVIGFLPENITVHTLSLKKGSKIMLEGTEIPGDGAVSEMLDFASDRLKNEGYEPYYLYRQKFTSGGFENVGYSKPLYESIYNVCMMEELSTVIALGGGGVTKLVSPNGRIERVFNVKYPKEYIERSGGFVEKARRIAEFYSAD